ncbi:MAG: hypothetical protein Q4A69_02725 [Moraxella sp.]|nr:hypothetical protein [Moraxella sp.]
MFLMPSLIEPINPAKPDDEFSSLSKSPTKPSTVFLSTVSEPATVLGIWANSLAMVSNWLFNAPITTSAVNLPSPAICRSLPILTPNPSAIAWARRGDCSTTLLNSSPRNAPADKP